MARRFFVDETKIVNNTILIDGNQHQHIAKVLRMKKGDELKFSSQVYEYECLIEEVQKAQTIARIVRKTKIEENLANLTIFQAFMKNEHMDFLVQKCTELGVKEFCPFLSKFVVVKPDQKKIEKLNRISFEACKQSGRVLPMNVLSTKTFNELLIDLKNFEQIVVAYEKDKTPAKDVLKSLNKNLKTAIIIGSEGGFAEDEITALKSIGAKTLSLGKNILRGETAGVVMSALVLYEFDEFC